MAALKTALDKGTESPEAIRGLLFSSKPSDVRLLYRNLSDTGRANAQAALLAHALEKFVLQLHAALLGAEDFAFHVFQLGRDVALAVRNGLLANVMLRNLVEIRLGDFDVITEDGIEPHLKRRDAGARAGRAARTRG